MGVCSSRQRGTLVALWLVSLFCWNHVNLMQLLHNKESETEVEGKKDDAYTSCLEETLLNLPINKRGQVKAHHWDAGNEHKFNHESRFDPMPPLQTTGCSVWEVGANIKAADTDKLRGMYPFCEYYAYEPIPVYFTQLTEHWGNKKGIINVHLRNYAIAKENGVLYFEKSSLAGESTYIGDGKKSPDNNDTDMATNNLDHVLIKSFDSAVKDAGGIKPTLLHMNCEGCEWDFLQQSIESGFIRDIPLIQIGFHNYGDVGLGRRAIEYCELRMQLSETHDLVGDAVAFAWERWELKGKNN